MAPSDIDRHRRRPEKKYLTTGFVTARSSILEALIGYRCVSFEDGVPATNYEKNAAKKPSIKKAQQALTCWAFL